MHHGSDGLMAALRDLTGLNLNDSVIQSACTWLGVSTARLGAREEEGHPRGQLAPSPAKRKGSCRTSSITALCQQLQDKA